MKHVFPLLAALVLILVPTAAVPAQSGGAFELNWFTVDGGGTFALGSRSGQHYAAAATGGTFELQGDFWNRATTGPLAVTLPSFGVTSDGREVLESWETVIELDNAKFELYCATSADWGRMARLAFAPSRGPGSSQGFAYSYRAEAAQPGKVYCYWLEDIDPSGLATQHGPVSATL